MLDGGRAPQLVRAMRAGAAAAILALLVAAAIAVSVASAEAEGLTVTYIGEWHGTGEAALQGPVALSVDRSGNVYVAEQLTNRVQVFTADGRFIRRLGGPRTCTVVCRPKDIDGRFGGPNGIAVDASGNVYVTDLGSTSTGSAGRVQKFAADGSFVTAFEGVGFDHFSYPRDVAVDVSGGVYVSDWGKSRVLLLDGGTGAFIREWAVPEFYPWGLAVDDVRGALYVLADDAVNPIVVLSLQGGVLTRLGQGFPRGKEIALDREGRLYVVGANVVRVFSPAGELLGQWGSTGSGPGEFGSTTGIAVDDQGLVYVADYTGGRVQVFRVEFDR
jgi:DNA-binding beta-propeller fold protein YncE